MSNERMQVWSGVAPLSVSTIVCVWMASFTRHHLSVSRRVDACTINSRRRRCCCSESSSSPVRWRSSWHRVRVRLLWSRRRTEFPWRRSAAVPPCPRVRQWRQPSRPTGAMFGIPACTSQTYATEMFHCYYRNSEPYRHTGGVIRA